jgi:sulfur-oxidizing protein SoxY
MTLTRREALGLTAGAAAFLTLAPRIAFAATEDTEAAIKAFTGGAMPESGKISLDTPEIAENGNTVPVGVSPSKAR